MKFWPYQLQISSLDCNQTHLCMSLAWKHLGIIPSNVLRKEMSKKEN